MKLRILSALAILALTSGSAWAGRACPSDVATGAGNVSEKAPHATRAAATHIADPAVTVPAAMPAHTVCGPGCSMPFCSPSDVVTSSGVTAAAHSASAESAPAAAAPHAAVKSAPAKAASRVPQRSAVAPAFGPLFLAHQALML